MINIGLVGCGKISGGYIKALAKIKDARILAACDVSKKCLEDFCKETGAKGYEDYKTMIKENAKELSLCIVAVPHSLHKEVTCFCAENKVNVLCEKPMSISSKDCDEMTEYCRQNGVMLWVANSQRFVEANIYAKKIIDSGELGSLIGFSETRTVNYFSETRPAWFTKKSLSGGGIMINLGSHTIDRLRFFCGNAKAEMVTGSVHIHKGSDCEDAAQAVLKMTNGVTATINLIGTTPNAEYRTTLYLEKGEIRIYGDDAVEKITFGKEPETKEFIAADTMKNQLSAAIYAVTSGDMSNVVSGEYGREIISIIKKIYGEEQ